MGRRKLEKFKENEERHNVIQITKPLFRTIKGRWNEVQFKNPNPIVLELACGAGEYTVGLAEKFPEKNYIGIDIKGNRIWKGSSKALERELHNVCFLRTHIEYLPDFFEPGEVSEIWISFPDPKIRDRCEKHRLTHPKFMEMYRKVLAPDGVVQLKTDSRELYDYTHTVLEGQNIKNLLHTSDLYNSDLQEYTYGIITHYESLFLEKGKLITYTRFSFAPLQDV